MHRGEEAAVARAGSQSPHLACGVRIYAQALHLAGIRVELQELNFIAREAV